MMILEALSQEDVPDFEFEPVRVKDFLREMDLLLLAISPDCEFLRPPRFELTSRRCKRKLISTKYPD